jgi:hypothetical protein
VAGKVFNATVPSVPHLRFGGFFIFSLGLTEKNSRSSGVLADFGDGIDAVHCFPDKHKCCVEPVIIVKIDTRSVRAPG